MLDGYFPLSKSILTSTIWREPAHVTKVWLTMLITASRKGVVLGSVPGLADLAHVSLDECVAALETLSGPDKWSRTKEFEGRRTEEIDGGWQILNYQKHREYLLGGSTAHAMRQERYNVRKRNKRHNSDATDHQYLDQDQYLNQEKNPPVSPPSVGNEPSGPIKFELIGSNEKPKRERKSNGKTKAPETIEPSEATLAVASETGRSWHQDWVSLRDWAWAKGELKNDWQAALRGWMRRSVETGRQQQKQRHPPQPNADTHGKAPAWTPPEST